MDISDEVPFDLPETYFCTRVQKSKIAIGFSKARRKVSPYHYFCYLCGNNGDSMLKDDIAPCNEEQFLQDIKKIINDGRNAAYGAVNSVMIRTNWAIGKRIVEQEQAGADRAEYGTRVIQLLSEELTNEYGKGFSARSLRLCRQVFLAFPSQEIWQTRLPNLTWSHYVELLRVDNEVARNWYLQEAASQQWSVRTLERNISSQYYFRLLQSQHKEPVEAEMKALTAPFQKDKLEFIKNPIVAEFLGLSPNLDFTETKLEAAIITQIQKFLLELGKGYAFVDRQQHIATDAGDFYIDLVFYNYILKCFLLIDLKTTRITHQDVGQMDMYVRMYDELKCGPDDNLLEPKSKLPLSHSLDHKVFSSALCA